MPVTELAILHLKSGVSLTDPSCRARLLQAKRVMENALGIPGRQFVYYQGVEDPSMLFLLGDWRSPCEHWEEFIPSPENQQLLELLKDDLDVPRIQMYHVDVPIATIPANSEGICIGWYRIRMEDKARFEEQMAHHTQLPSDILTQGREAAGGWRIEKPDDVEDEEQWVHFYGWDNVERDKDSDQGNAWVEDGRLKNLVLGFELKHGTRTDIELQDHE